MSAKEVKFGVEARDRMLRGVDIRFWRSAMKRREYITLLVVAAGIWPSVRLLFRVTTIR